MSTAPAHRPGLVELAPDDAADLARAVQRLENPGLAIRMTNLIGKPVETGLSFLPRRISEQIGDLSRHALEHAYRAAAWRMEPVSTARPASLRQRAIVAASGAVGGAGGIFTLPLELPVTTVAIMAEIAAHARANGEDLSDTRTRAECISVFALGGRNNPSGDADLGYFALRHTLAQQVSTAARAAATKPASLEVAPGMLQLIHTVARRFGVAVSEKAAAQAVPILGAIAGASINVVFIDHFRNTADGHFTIRRLERQYGAGPIAEHYALLRAEPKA